MTLNWAGEALKVERAREQRIYSWHFAAAEGWEAVSGVEGGVVKPVQSELTAVGRVGAWGAAGVGAVGRGRVLGGV